jgi:hypothetical protein
MGQKRQPSALVPAGPCTAGPTARGACTGRAAEVSQQYPDQAGFHVQPRIPRGEQDRLAYFRLGHGPDHDRAVLEGSPQVRIVRTRGQEVGPEPVHEQPGGTLPALSCLGDGFQALEEGLPSRVVSAAHGG